MKTKLTLTIDRDLVPRAKRMARERGVSLSSIVEDVLREMTGEAGPSFSERWRGAFELAEGTEDARYEALREKYG